MVKKHTSRGFTLIEALFATFLVAVCAAIIAATVPIANSSRGRADMANVALNIGQQQMEAVRGVGFPNITPSALSSAGLLDGTSPDPNGRYAFHGSDSANFGAPRQLLPEGKGWLRLENIGFDLKKITVTIEWLDRGATKSITLCSLVGNL